MPAAIPGRIATQVRINEELYKKTKFIAKQENRNTNSQIEYFIKLGVESYEKAQGTISLLADE